MILAIITFIVLLLMNVPIAFTIGISAGLYFMLEPALIEAIAVQRMVAGTQAFPLLAVPFYILAGHLMNASGVTSRLIDFADAIIGHVIGGIAQISILLSLFMAGLSGSSNADVAMQTRMLMPSMRERGYHDGFSTVVLAYSSLAVALIPPSIGLILYGFVGQVSIANLFIAGIVPGLLMSAALMVCVHFISGARGYDANRPRVRRPVGDIFSTFRKSIWALLFPVLLVITIRFGVFTPTEAGAFAVVYTIIVGCFIHRELNWAGINEAVKKAVIDNGVILLIISMAAILGFVFSFERIPQNVAVAVTALASNPIALIILMITFLLLAGTIMEGSVVILLLTPIFLPIAKNAGMDPVQFGIVMSMVIQIGGVTPPVGINMYTACSISGTPVIDFLKESAPFLLAMLITVALVAVFPALSLWLPKVLL
jgi:tripartite ATP-independent transporter DctM subunit